MKDTKNFSRVWACGYCDLSNIMRGTAPQFYNCGVYGWNCDIYADYNTDQVITTGYRNMRGEWIPRETLDHFDKKARAELRKKSKNFKEFYQAISDLLKSNKYKNNYQILLTSKA